MTARRFNPKSLANLKRWPKGYCPAGMTWAQSTAHLPRCGDSGGKRVDGQPCGRLALKGATRCARHGGRQQQQAKARREAQAPKQPKGQRAARAWRELDPPRDLQRTETWKRAQQVQSPERRLRLLGQLVRAWDAYQQGDGREWRRMAAQVAGRER